MDILKYIVCLIIAAIIYFIVGLIAWNIVCSWVDMSSCTLVEISNYRIYTYSGIACISAIIAEIRVGIKNGRDMDGACTILFVITLPKDWVQKVCMQNVRVYVSGENLLTITKFKGIDPEMMSGVGYAPMRQYAFGVNVTF